MTSAVLTAEGRYTIHERIAAGGMATVHLGRLIGPHGFGRTVAVKKLHAQYALDPEFVAAFLDEAQLTARIRHPNVVPMLDVVSSGDELYLIMEYIEGESLSGLLRRANARRAHLPPGVVSSIVTGVLGGLHAAHEVRDDRGEPLHLVHRDVSPHNVLVGRDGIARVIDFGVAKAFGRSRLTAAGQIKGKLAYMPPEQLEGGVVTRRADVFASAVVLWEALTGKRLFAADSEGEVVAKVRALRIAPPSTVAPWVPSIVDAVVMRALARNPEDRFCAADEMAAALERAIPVASAGEVGKLVADLASEPLAERARHVAQMKQGAGARVPLPYTEPVREEAPTIRDSSPVFPPTDEPGQTKNPITASMPATATRGRAVSLRGLVGLGFAAFVLAAGTTLLLGRSHGPTAARSSASASRSMALASATPFAATGAPVPASAPAPAATGDLVPSDGLPPPMVTGAIAAPVAASDSVVSTPGAGDAQGAASGTHRARTAPSAKTAAARRAPVIEHPLYSRE